ncbi:MAG TPA: 50S ribosomal protein L15e [Candidatus Paceibacterota bacterium]|nr:50S ribosomal protein L15e [Candidatus Paceibacterota bacterium]
MAKGMYHYIGQAWKKPDIKLLRERMIEWRKEESVVEVAKPLRLDRARSLGYKAKKGYFVARVKIIRGGKQRPRPKKRRKVGNLRVKKTLSINYQTIAEQRAQKKYHNLEVLNSYNIGKDGIYAYYEVIMVDPQRPEIKNDPTINWICNPKNKKRVYRGLTSSAKKGRGLK